MPLLRQHNFILQEIDEVHLLNDFQKMKHECCWIGDDGQVVPIMLIGVLDSLKLVFNIFLCIGSRMSLATSLWLLMQHQWTPDYRERSSEASLVAKEMSSQRYNKEEASQRSIVTGVQPGPS